MFRDQRAHDNHALLAAQAIAQEKNTPLYVLFVLQPVPGRSREQYDFMLTGLYELRDTLAQKNIPLVLRVGSADTVIPAFCEEISCGALFFDFSPLRLPRTIAKTMASTLAMPTTVIDTHNIIPAWVTSSKCEFAAHTIRRKIHTHLEHYLVEPPTLQDQALTVDTPHSSSDTDIAAFLSGLPSSGITPHFASGEHAARARLEEFIATKLPNYAVERNNPTVDGQSNLSPYLHFGQISALRVALEVIKVANQPPLLLLQPKMAEAGDTPSAHDGMNVLFEEMIVRKELSDNYCLYTPEYDSLKSMPEWAQKTLDEHRNDVRDFVYTREQWENAETHDPAWNAAQNELRQTGKMHGYMRMYWAKKLLEWSASPEEAIATGLYLNDFYSLDGGDPNGFVGVLWSIAGLHDRAWFERPVYGKIRYMNAGGLKRKFDVDAYIQRFTANPHLSES